MNCDEAITKAISNIPLRYRDLSFDNLITKDEEQRKVFKIIKQYVATFNDRLKEGCSMIFVGYSGTGKTMLARVIQQELIRLYHSVCYLSASDLLRQLEKNDFCQLHLSKTVEKEYLTCSLLIIDDVSIDAGFSDLSRSDQQLLFSLINSRYQNMTATLLISDHPTSYLRDLLGNPLINRVLENGLVLAFNWDSHRK